MNVCLTSQFEYLFVYNFLDPPQFTTKRTLFQKTWCQANTLSNVTRETSKGTHLYDLRWSKGSIGFWGSEARVCRGGGGSARLCLTLRRTFEAKRDAAPRLNHDDEPAAAVSRLPVRARLVDGLFLPVMILPISYDSVSATLLVQKTLPMFSIALSKAWRHYIKRDCSSPLISWEREWEREPEKYAGAACYGGVWIVKRQIWDPLRQGKRLLLRWEPGLSLSR